MRLSNIINYPSKPEKENGKNKREYTSKWNIKNSTSIEIFGTSQIVEPQKCVLGCVKLLGNAPHGAPGRHHISIVHYLLTVDIVAAARQRNPQLLARQNQVGIAYIIYFLNLWEGNEAGKHFGGDVVEAVVGNHRVIWAPVGYSGVFSAYARERNLDRLLGGNGSICRGVEGEVVGAKN